VDTGSVAGQAVFNVIDYKMSRAPRRFATDDVEFGRALQLLVYSFAVRKLGLVDGDLFQFGYWSLNGDGFVCGLKQGPKAVKRLETEVATGLEDILNRVLPRLVQSIRQGIFPLVVDDPSETYNGDYNAVARLGPFRSVAEVLGKSAERSPRPAASDEV
jgi:hypothetical protein